jgi:hypothetical protein
LVFFFFFSSGKIRPRQKWRPWGLWFLEFRHLERGHNVSSLQPTLLWTDLFTYLPPPFNTTTLIKLMNEEEEEAPLEDPHIRRNRLARERHAARSEKQREANANRRATHRATRNDAQIAADASRRATQRAVRSDAQITADAS